MLPSHGYRVVSVEGVRLLVFEALRVKAMSARPKARRDDAGRLLRNNAHAKPGLNAGILGECLGKTLDSPKTRCRDATG